jgi:hypothetical protein
MQSFRFGLADLPFPCQDRVNVSQYKNLKAPSWTPAEKNIDATIRIGQEIRCLPYARFYLLIPWSG